MDKNEDRCRCRYLRVLLKPGMEWDALERKSRVLERFSRGVTCSYRTFPGMATENVYY